VLHFLLCKKSISVTKTCILILREIIVVYCEKHGEPVCGQNTEFLFKHAVHTITFLLWRLLLLRVHFTVSKSVPSFNHCDSLIDIDPHISHLFNKIFIFCTRTTFLTQCPRRFYKPRFLQVLQSLAFVSQIIFLFVTILIIYEKNRSLIVMLTAIKRTPCSIK
jgi:hypothetical protein